MIFNNKQEVYNLDCLNKLYPQVEFVKYKNMICNNNERNYKHANLCNI